MRWKGKHIGMELGSEFSIDLTQKQIVEHNISACLAGYHTLYTDYGRTANALLYQYLQAKKKTKRLKVLLPSYSCEAVCESFPHDAIVFYDLKENFVIDIESVQMLIGTGDFDNGIFYLTHYFGLLQKAEILERIRGLCNRHQITIVEDTTHSILGEECTIGEYCVASLRKWFPIPEGGVVYSKNALPEEWNRLEKAKASKKIEAMVLKSLFLRETEEYQDLAGLDVINQAYRKIYAGEEQKASLSHKPLRISDLSHFLLQCEDVRAISNTRQKNYFLLQEKLLEKGMVLYGAEHFKNNPKAVPFTAVLKIEEKSDITRNGLREYLMNNRIYCAVHWPIWNEIQGARKKVKEWADNCLSLPVDQRYGEKEMEYLADQVIAYFEGAVKRGRKTGE